MTTGYLYILFGETTMQVLAHFLVGLLVFFGVDLYVFFINLGY